ncbi:MAG TPA: four helix bundle protein [Lacipirellulaceae bacterium]
MTNYELRDRTKQFALRIIRMYSALPKTEVARVIGKQLLRAGTSAAANYREASRGRTDCELLAKLGIVEQELDESLLWMELLVESDIIAAPRIEDLRRECEELLRMTVASIKTLKSRR